LRWGKERELRLKGQSQFGWKKLGPFVFNSIRGDEFGKDEVNNRKNLTDFEKYNGCHIINSLLTIKVIITYELISKGKMVIFTLEDEITILPLPSPSSFPLGIPCVTLLNYWKGLKYLNTSIYY